MKLKEIEKINTINGSMRVINNGKNVEDVELRMNLDNYRQTNVALKVSKTFHQLVRNNELVEHFRFWKNKLTEKSMNDLIGRGNSLKSDDL